MNRPTHPELARLFDEALRKGHEIRYADDERLVIWQRNEWGCGGLIVLVILGLLTAFIVPLILLLLGALAPGGRIFTYTVQANGKVKKNVEVARGR